MPRYQIKPGETLAHGGTLLEHPAIVELPRVTADDMAVRHAVQEIDASGHPVLAPVAEVLRDTERFKPHEQVTLLERALEEAEQRVAALRTQLEAARAAATPAPAPASPAASPKSSASASTSAGKER